LRFINITIKYMLVNIGIFEWSDNGFKER